MGATDWSIVSGGTASIDHYAVQHVNVPDHQLAHDVWCRKVDNDNATQHGRFRFKYTREPGNFTVNHDVSVRAAVSMGLNGGVGTAVGLGVRMNDTVPTQLTNNKVFCTEGYLLLLEDYDPDYALRLYRVTGGTPQWLWSIDDWVTGVSGQHHWFHLRLDFLLQPNNDAILQVWANDVTLNPVTAPVWTKVSTDIAQEEAGGEIPAFDGVGWGAQVAPGGPLVNEVYTDWLEVWHSV